MKNKKILFLTVVNFVSVILANVSAVWVFVEFVKYIAKDTKFNWWSIVSFFICVFIVIFVTFYVAISESKKNGFNAPTKRKSRFELKMEEAMKNRGY